MVTRGHKTLGSKWLFEPLLSHQQLLYLDSEVVPKSPSFHTATVRLHIKKKQTNEKNYYYSIIGYGFTIEL